MVQPVAIQDSWTLLSATQIKMACFHWRGRGDIWMEPRLMSFQELLIAQDRTTYNKHINIYNTLFNNPLDNPLDT